MARYTGPSCKLCRRERQKLFLKGSKCHSQKCPLETKNYAPGAHGLNRRMKFSEYGVQLREKQKVKRIYGLLETQFHTYYEKANRQKGITGDNLLKLLESRLDNVVYRLGFAPSQRAARQLVSHKHLLVNGVSTNIPSFLVKVGDVISVREKSQKMEIIHESLKRVSENPRPYLKVDKATLEGSLLETPKREDIMVKINEQLIVELYSK